MLLSIVENIHCYDPCSAPNASYLKKLLGKKYKQSIIWLKKKISHVFCSKMNNISPQPPPNTFKIHEWRFTNNSLNISFHFMYAVCIERYLWIKCGESIALTCAVLNYNSEHGKEYLERKDRLSSEVMKNFHNKQAQQHLLLFKNY